MSFFCQVTCYNRFQTYLKSRVVLHPAGSLDLCQLCSLFLNCPDPNTLPHEAIAIQRKCQWLSTLTCILSQVICQLSNLLKTRFQGVLGVWVYTHIYIYICMLYYIGSIFYRRSKRTVFVLTVRKRCLFNQGSHHKSHSWTFVTDCECQNTCQKDRSK